MDSTSTVRLPPSSEPADKILAASSPLEVLNTLYGPVLQPLAQVEASIKRELQSPYESVTPVLRHGTQLGGKRLRPAMLLLVADAVGRVSSAHITLGTVIEMVHTATLIHDDVLDEASTRRHVQTVNARWNNHTSILLGDYLFAQSFRLAATMESTEACRWIGEAARKVCEGELRQVLDRNLIELDEETYIDMLRGKTAELCRVACQLGAKFAGADEAIVNAIGKFGDYVGIAFQIADDYLDLWGDDREVGKTLGTDIQQGKMTLPLIRLLQTASESERGEIEAIIAGPVENRVASIRPWLLRSDAKQYTSSTAERYKQLAIDQLESIPAGASKDCLIAIANFATDRPF